MWSHLDFIFRDYEINAMDETVTYTPAGGTVTGYSVSVGGPSQSLFIVTAGASGIKAQSISDHLRGLYPIKLVGYMDQDLNEYVVDDWNNVPNTSIMTRFEPDPENITTFPITCVCNWLTNSVPPAPMVDTVVLDIAIWQHYDINQQSLITKISEEL